MRFSVRWLLVAGVLVWLGHEYATPLWTALWDQYATHLKFAFGVTLVLGLLCMPSVESLAQRHPSVYALVRQFAVDDGLHTDYTTPIPMSTAGVHDRVHRGMLMGGATAPPAVQGLSAAPPPVVAAPPSVDTLLQARAPDLRKRLASAQQWKCAACDGPLCATYRVTANGAVCARCT